MRCFAVATLCVIGLSAFAPAARAEDPTYKTALFIEAGGAFVPFAIDVPLMAGGGVRFADVHEIWGRAGYIPTGDDAGLGFACGGYRVVLRPHKLVRPTFGLLTAGLPQTCTHDARRRPSCTETPLFIFAATAGVRFEPTPWLGISSILTLGTDTYPNPFGMMELDVSFAIPLL